MTIFDNESLAALSHAKALRLELLNSCIGDKLPDGSDVERAKLLRDLINDIEKGELGLAKVKIANKANEAQNANSALLVELIKQTRLTASQRPRPQTAGDLILPAELEQELEEGETTEGYESIGYDELMGGPEDE